MRTTISIDDDIMAAARNLARGNDESIGKAISDLARRGLQANSTRLNLKRRANTFPTFTVTPNSRMITLDDVHRAEDEA